MRGCGWASGGAAGIGDGGEDNDEHGEVCGRNSRQERSVRGNELGYDVYPVDIHRTVNQSILVQYSRIH